MSFHKKVAKVIISLTSFPARIDGVHLTINSLLNQTVAPDLIVLWLAQSQFPKKDEDLPSTIKDLDQDIFEVRWCEDIRSYKKLIPTLINYPDSIIITVDDDVIYESDLIRKLIIGSETHPNCVIAARTTKVLRKHGVLFVETGGSSYWDNPSFLNKLVGCSGCLYPPNCLDPEVMNVDAFMTLAPTSDDVWFWLMAVRAGTKVYRIPDGEWLPKQNRINSGRDSLSYINDGDEGLFYHHLDSILASYPDVYNALMQEKIEQKSRVKKRTSKKIGYIAYSIRRMKPVKELYRYYLKRKNASLSQMRYLQRHITLLEKRLSILESDNHDSSEN